MTKTVSYVLEQYVAGAVGMVPEVGSFLSAFVYILWPDGKSDVWSEVQAQTQALIDQSLDELVQEEVNASLEGLYNNINAYNHAIAIGDAPSIARKWDAANSQFLQQMPTFQMPSYQLLLLPEFAQLANMHLALLRDGVLGGAGWGWSPATVTQCQADLTRYIADYTSYTNQVYSAGLNSYANDTVNIRIWNTRNKFVREMTLNVLDFMNMWCYFDLNVYPGPTTIYLPREIYSDICGKNTDSGAMKFVSAPTAPMTQLSVWAWDRVDAAQATYSQGAGPGGLTQTARMGDQSGGSNAAPHGGVFNLGANPIAAATAATGDIINYMYFNFADGSQSNKLGGNYPGGTEHTFAYDGEIVSSVLINGISNFYGSADCVVFGFQYANPMQVAQPHDALMLVTTPKLSNTQIAALTAPTKIQRENYWAQVASSAAKA
jgi:delta endotoxin, N-terminal domain